jgi:protein-tyrosine phosphatase
MDDATMLDEVLPNVYLCGLQEIQEYHVDDFKDNWVVICVLDELKKLDDTMKCLNRIFANKPNIRFVHLPIMIYPEDETHPDIYTTESKLNKVSVEIDRALRNKNRVIVHCGAGFERSPLCIAHYIVKKFNKTYEEAYRWISRFRMIANRSNWIEG